MQSIYIFVLKRSVESLDGEEMKQAGRMKSLICANALNGQSVIHQHSGLSGVYNHRT